MSQKAAERAEEGNWHGSIDLSWFCVQWQP
jgi:hypothetical protein